MNTPNSATPTLFGDWTPPAGLSPTTAPATARNSLSADPSSDPEHTSVSDVAPARDEEKGPTTTRADDDNIVTWDGPDDPECPRNWPVYRKVPYVIVTSAMVAAVSFGSSVIAPGEHDLAEYFHVSPVVSELSVALWILGFFAGPVFFGPTSEVFGHLIPYLTSIVGVLILQIPIAVAENLRTVLICRFFSGVFGSGVLAIVSGTYYELYEPIPRGVALASSAVSLNLGATIAPIAGAYLVYDVQWRWTAWTTMIFSGVLIFLAFFTMQETSSRRLLRLRARRLRFETHNWALHSKAEETPIEISDIVQRYLTKPIRMIVAEPILIIITIYLTLVYGTLYLSFQAFPVAYQQRGWSVPTSELPFVAVILGIVSAFCSSSAFTMTLYRRRVEAGGVPVPEYRLPPMILGGVVLPPSLLWFGWSGGVHWISQVLAGFVIGYGLMLIFITGIIYLVDVYGPHANSAISIHVVVRSFISSSFPLFANLMFDRLGVNWGSSLLALLCLVMVPAPILFYYYGKKIRSWSRFSESIY